MTTANTDDVECEDGETRPRSLCVETHDGRWIESSESVTLYDGTVCHPDDDGICYVSSRDEWHWEDACCIVNDEWERDVDCTICAGCRDTILEADLCTGPDDCSLCEGCYEFDVAHCSNCGYLQWSDACNFDEDGHCADCQDSDSLIANYSDKSANHLRPEGLKEIGIELEVEGASLRNRLRSISGSSFRLRTAPSSVTAVSVCMVWRLSLGQTALMSTRRCGHRSSQTHRAGRCLAGIPDDVACTFMSIAASCPTYRSARCCAS